jgi:transcriptional regulator with XRE-family HTH domain
MTGSPRSVLARLPVSPPRSIRGRVLFRPWQESLSSASLFIVALIWYIVNMHLYTSCMARPTKNKPAPLELGISPLGPRLAQLRKLKGYSQESLAESMGISRKQITDYETGRVHMNDEMVVRFAIALKVSADTLLGLKEIDMPIENQSIRFTKRLRDLEQLPEMRKRAIVKILDELVRTNS